MDKKELVLLTAKDIFLKALESKNVNLSISAKGGAEAIADLGDRFKTLVQKVAEALDVMKD